MNVVGLRFLLENGGGFLQLIMPMEEAHLILNRYQGGQLPTFLSGQLKPEFGGVAWVIESKRIIAIHTFDPNAVQQQPQQQQHVWNRSGL